MTPVVWPAALLLAAFPGRLDRISSAETCGRCHRDILQAWKTSTHATALENPLFQDALDLAVEESGATARATCLSCHAPTVQHSGDTELVRKTSWEGVTCDFCHSLKAVTFAAGVPRITVAFDGVKTGPLKDAASIAHGVAFSPVHASSLVCAPCHEYRNPSGLPVLTTYSEWQDSSYAKKSVHCQSCHMSLTAAKVVDPKIKRTPQTSVNLHQMPGSHSIDQLNKAVSTRLATARRGDALEVTVELTNRGAGHMVPTGSPLRRLHLEVRVNSSDGKSYNQERVYRRGVLDAQGRPIEREHQVFLQAARFGEDTRLKPEQRRVETFTFPVPGKVAANVRTQLWYYYSPFAAAHKRVSFHSLAQYSQANR
jgi:hypothetical protein